MNPASIQDRAYQMPPQEAVDYLCGVVESLAEALKLEEGDEFDAPCELKMYERRLLAFLAERPGRIVPQQQLFAAMYWDRHTDEMPALKLVQVYVSRLRKKLPPTYGTIETVWYQGYIFTPAKLKRPHGAGAACPVRRE